MLHHDGFRALTQLWETTTGSLTPRISDPPMRTELLETTMDHRDQSSRRVTPTLLSATTTAAYRAAQLKPPMPMKMRPLVITSENINPQSWRLLTRSRQMGTKLWVTTTAHRTPKETKLSETTTAHRTQDGTKLTVISTDMILRLRGRADPVQQMLHLGTTTRPHLLLSL